MGVPAEIRAVERPKNTTVVPSGNGYRVRQRVGCKNVGGRRIPVDGKYIGSIIDGKYVPDEPIAKTGTAGRVDIKYYGRIKLCWMLNNDIMDMLRPHYNDAESKTIYCLASLRACYPGTRDYQLKDRYCETFISEMFPDINLGKNQVCNELQNLGKEYSRIRKFMRDRVAQMKENDTLVIDGCLKQNHSRIDTLSQLSRKTSMRKHKDSLMMYAYNPDTREPICSKLYPGNIVDSRAVGDFIDDNHIDKGVIVADKGFTLSAIKDAIDGKDGLHYILPLKDNSDLIIDHNMYSFDGSFHFDGIIECKKLECDGYWMYSFRDPKIARDEEESYLEEHDGTDDIMKLDELRKTFGTLVFQSDLDAPASKIYSIYTERWLIELLFRFYQTELDMDDTRVNSDYSDIGSDFVDFLSALMGSRMLNRFQDMSEMERWTFKSSMDFLDRAKMVRIDDSEEWEMNRLPIRDIELLSKIGIVERPIVPVVIKKKGRPMGRKDTKPRKVRSDKGTKRESSERV